MSDFDERLEREKLESLKELAYGASHEINNPLANIAARAQTLLEDETDPERRRKLAAIHRQAMRAHEMIADLMLFARPPKLELAAVQSAAARRAASSTSIASWPPEREIELACDVCERRRSSCRPTQRNWPSRSAPWSPTRSRPSAPAGSVHVTARRTESAGESWAEVIVRDDGPGISPEVRRHMFDPFFSGREAGRGLGFGLSKCWRIVTDHGGQVVVNQPVGRGAEIAIRFKVTADERR